MAQHSMEREAEAFRRLHSDLLATIPANMRRFVMGNWLTTTLINWFCPASHVSRRQC